MSVAHEITTPEPFDCPTCKVRYKIVRMEAAAGPTIEPQVTCVNCGAPFQAREGAFLLKYFLVEGRRRRAS